MCRGIILVKNISLDRNAGPLLLQCVYQVTSENLKNMKSNTQIYSFENKPAGPEKKNILLEMLNVLIIVHLLIKIVRKMFFTLE